MLERYVARPHTVDRIGASRLAPLPSSARPDSLNVVTQPRLSRGWRRFNDAHDEFSCPEIDRHRNRRATAIRLNPL